MLGVRSKGTCSSKVPFKLLKAAPAMPTHSAATHDDYNKVTISGATNSGSALYAPIQICNIELKFQIDSGAALTLMSRTAYNRLPHHRQPPLQPVDVVLQNASGDPITCHGQCDVRMLFGNLLIPATVVVADIDGDGLLGLDFLEEQQYNLSSRDGLFLRGRKVTTIRQHSAAVHRILVRDKTTIPAGASAVLVGRVKTPLPSLSVLEAAPHVECSYGLKMASSCVKAGRDPEVEMIVLNPTAEEVVIKRGAHLANASLVAADADIYRPDLPASCEADSSATPHHAVNTCQPVNREKQEKLTKLITEAAKEADLSLAQKEQLQSLIFKYADCFSANATDLGRTSLLKHHIDTGSTPPIRFRPRRPPKAFQPHEDELIDQLLESGVIKPTDSPWSHPAVFVKKQSGEWRICFDGRALNKVTKKDSFPLPSITECLDGLAGSKFYSALDLNQAYFQVELEESAKEKCSFSTTKGHWSYEVLPMGLCNSVATFSRLVTEVFKGMLFNGVVAYLDDLLVPCATVPEGLQRLEAVFQRLRAANLKLKPEKCKLLQRETKFLGYILSEDGVRTDPAKIKDVVNWPTPRNVTDVRAYLGLTGFYRKWVRGYAQIASPLTRLLEKNRDFVWTTECETAFTTLRDKLLSSDVLAFPKDEGMYILDCDASGVGIGGVLSQQQWCDRDNTLKEKPIAYASKTLSKAERRYCVTRRELLAVVVFVTQFKHHLLGQKFLLRTDHSSLRWLCSFKDPRDQLARWLEVLQQYDFDIQHRKGQLHGNADAMSRCCSNLTPCGEFKRGIPVEELPCGGCSFCKRHNQEWEAFYELDDVVPLSHNPAAPYTDAATPSSTPDATPHQLPATGISLVTTPTPSSTPDVTAGPSQTTESWAWREGTVFTKTEIVKAQGKDRDLRKVVSWVKTGARPPTEEMKAEGAEIRNYWLNFDLLRMVDGVLCRKWVADATEKTDSLLVVLPRSLKKEALQLLHDHPSSGHFGINTTVERVKEQFFWYCLRRDVETYVKSCSICQHRKKPTKRPKAPLKPFFANNPMEEISIDMLGPFPVSDRGNRYILNVICKFTRFAECYAVPEISTPTIADVLVNQFMSRWGVPWEILSDQGANFDSALFKEICHLLNITKKRTSSYHPQCNGLVENLNKSITRMLSAYVAAHQRDWCQHLPWVMAAYRSHKHPSTGYSPNYLMFGREVSCPANLAFGTPSPLAERNPAEFAQQMDDRLQDAYAVAREHLGTRAQQNKRDYDLSVSHHLYNQGDAVLLLDSTRKQGVSKKLSPNQWSGPFIIARRLSDLLYEIQPRDENKKKVVHYNRLKPYREREELPWMRKARAQMATQQPEVPDTTPPPTASDPTPQPSEVPDATPQPAPSDPITTPLPENSSFLSGRPKRSALPPVRFRKNES